MRSTPVRVLLVETAEGSPTLAMLSAIPGVVAERAAGYEEGLRRAVAGGHDVVLADWRIGDRLGIELLWDAVAGGCAAPVVLLGDDRDPDFDLDAMRAGAVQFLLHSELSPGVLEPTLRFAIGRKRAEDELRESRRRLATLLSNLPGMAYRCRNDPAWSLDFASEGSRELTGWDPADLVERAKVAWADLIHADDRPRVWQTVQAAISTGRPFEVEYRIRRRDGEERWVAENGRAVAGAGRAAVLEGFICDVTERKRAEAAVRRSGEYFRALIETAAEVFAVGNADGTLRYVSPAIERLTGAAPEAWLGTTLFARVHPDDRDAVRAAFDRALAEPGVPVVAETRLRHRDGGWRAVEVACRNLLDDPAVGGIVYNAHDVTERRGHEATLLRREQQWRALIERGQDIITVVRDTGEVGFASPSVERVLGYAPDALLGSYLFELVHPDEVPAVLDVFARAIEEPGRPERVELRMRHRDGTWRILETIVTSLLHDPAVEGIVVNSRDVTERKQAEEALAASRQQFLQAQKMDAVGRLAGGVAHDFNNLLTAIRGNAELLLLDLPAGAPGAEEVEEIRRAADRAAGLTRQLLAFSRRQVLQPRVFGLNAVVRDMEKMLGRLIGEDVALVTRLADDLAHVRADPGQLEQVVMNLAVNARDAMPSGGQLIVETRNAVLDEEMRRTFPYVVPGPYVMLAVSDTGHGMDRETRERVFEPFFTTKPAGRGTGLGLSTVYGIVKQSGGYIWVYSEPGRGTTVRIYLPSVAGGARPAGPAAAAAPARGGVETILLAEDEEPVRRLAREVLTRNGYTVLEAGDGEQALRVSERHPGRIDLLVTDVVMPAMSGRDLSALLAAARPALRVLYMSGYTEEAVARHGVLDPGTGFIEKPFTADALASAVRRVLDEAVAPGPRG
ncbi:MAG TPA: PAS domain S-box protein [Longimicrobium sp.]|nr:PAS domain S-box protein [Longimicrobium sp.]